MNDLKGPDLFSYLLLLHGLPERRDFVIDHDGPYGVRPRSHSRYEARKYRTQVRETLRNLGSKAPAREFAEFIRWLSALGRLDTTKRTEDVVEEMVDRMASDIARKIDEDVLNKLMEETNGTP